ncbi:MAG: hypothetical protein JXR86_21370 [Spirochaetales bacterium]|nr:hypothetical protein [Spirochaetales bacterium]
MITPEYREYDRRVDEFFAEEEYGKALELLSEMKNLFPGELHGTLFYMLACYEKLGEIDHMVHIIEEALEKNIFFPINDGFFGEALKSHSAYPGLNKRCLAMRDAAQNETQPEHKVFLPDNYDPGKKYPLFIVLHGDGEDLDFMAEFWKPHFHTGSGMIALYLQSGKVYGFNTYFWTGDFDNARREIRMALETVSREYNVDTDNIFIGGFSGGSMAALSAVLNADIPVRGYIGLCPVDKGFLSDDMLNNRPFNLKAVILKGEQGGDREIGSIPDFLERSGIDCRLETNRGFGHWFPDDLEMKINRAMEFILSDES